MAGKKYAFLAAAVAAVALAAGGYWSFADRADLAHGQRLYKECTGCHARQKIAAGPPHCGLFGRPAGSVEGYAYSDAMRSSGIVWDARRLDEFLKAPLNYVRGTNMGYAGLANPTDRRDLIGYLKQATHEASFCAEMDG